MKNQTKQHSSDTHQPTIGRSGGGDQPRPSSLNRRSFLSRAGAATAVVAAATVGLPSPLLSQNTDDPPEVSDNIS